MATNIRRLHQWFKIDISYTCKYSVNISNISIIFLHYFLFSESRMACSLLKLKMAVIISVTIASFRFVLKQLRLLNVLILELQCVKHILNKLHI